MQELLLHLYSRTPSSCYKEDSSHEINRHLSLDVTGIPLKTIQSIAAAMVWRQGHGKELLLPLGLFGVHLLLGNWWNVVFFSRHKMNESVKWMGLFWASIAGTAAAFAPISRPAAYMMLPTLAWVSVAWKLNVDIVRLNMGGPEAAKKNHEN
uniref:Uncharacterized protein n=1 Tax=Dunaliella tertiolecta TaxID=3047 RepID=A0A7S3VHR7_DUNTE